MDTFLAILYAIGLYGAFMAGMIHLRRQAAATASSTGSNAILRRPPWLTLILIAAIGIPTALQFVFPSMLPLLRRDTAAFFAGDWWRIITSVFVQDGGVSGSIFNLLSLLLVGAVAEQVWGRGSVLILFFGGGLIGEVAGLAWQPVGAGNSVANFSLAGGMAVACLMQRSSKSVQLAALLTLVAAGVLVALKDIHGPATFAGAFLALLLSRLQRT
jgi:membrane associated rhomboid family serine protease